MAHRPPRPGPGSSPPDALLRRRHRFYRLLLAVCAVVIATMALPGRWSSLIFPGHLLLTGMVVSELGGAVGGGARRPEDNLYRLLGAAVMVLLPCWLLLPGPVRGAAVLLACLVGVFYLWTLLRLVGWLAQEPLVTRRVVSGALAGYLLLGICGGLLLCMIESLDPGSFRSALDGTDPMMQGGTLALGSPLSLAWERNFMRVHYFAFVSLTTVGFGDIIPVRPPAQLASLLLSVAGPLYIAVVMGVLISRLTAVWGQRDQD